ncbi:MAG: helix-turn-helix domain-containing protein [Candidatus Omnitrophica bacterium]|nr:helix-turn-helix domain-containing protein [Candidatus Omnitrophota bacterium]
MITVLIVDNEEKAKELLSGLLHQEGYSNLAQENIFKIVKKDTVQDPSALKNKVIELEDALFREKHGMLYKSILEEIEKTLLEHVLERTEGNQLKAAKILGLNRNTIRSKLKKLGIVPRNYKC